MEGSKTAVYCKQHAADGLVNIQRTRCLHDSCTKVPSFNVEGSRTAAFCKQHAEDGMVDIQSSRCSHDSCTRHPSFNVEGSKTAVYCKQHAEDGMVNIRRTHCSHDSCTKVPSFKAEGSKTAAFCKQHAEDGIVHVLGRRCSHDSCTKQAYLSVEGRKAVVYCKQYADDMVNVRSMRCSHESCTKRPSFSAEGSKRPMCCEIHAEDGTVNAFTSRSSNDARRAVPGRGLPNNLETTACTRLNTEFWDDSRITVRKRSRWTLGGKQPPHPLGYRTLGRGVVETGGMGTSDGVSHTTSSLAFRREGNHDSVERVTKRSRTTTSEALASSPDKHHSGETIKTEREVVVLL